MSGPERLRLKRRLGDQPPDWLIVDDHAEPKRIKYVLRHAVEPSISPVQSTVRNTHVNPTVSEKVRRTFHLSRVRAAASVSNRKRKGRDYDVATVVEKKPTQDVLRVDDNSNRREDVQAGALHAANTLKRPGKGSSVKVGQPREDRMEVSPSPLPVQNQENVQSMADQLHQFALDELAKESKPKMTSMPRLAGARSREIHRQRAAMSPPPTSQEDVEMQEEIGEYVFDTYVLAPSTPHEDEPVVAQLASQNIGYIVITDEDIQAWEMYMEDEASDKDCDSDESDENAEGYYGADYPEDEMASDDEHDRGAYGYRKHAGSDDEEYNEDTGAFSDHGEDDESFWRTKAASGLAQHTVGPHGAT